MYLLLSLLFTTPYQKVDTLVMYRIGEPQPDNIKDLIGKKVRILPAAPLFASAIRCCQGEGSITELLEGPA